MKLLKFLFLTGAAHLMIIEPTGLNAQNAGQVLQQLGQNTGVISEATKKDGIKEALKIAAGNSVKLTGKPDGFLKNNTIKIPFPPEAKQMEKTLRKMGMNKQADEFVVSVNRAAEDAVKSALPIFEGAVKDMSISDAAFILRGQSNEATNYMKQKTGDKLHSQFKPIVKSSIDKVQVTKYWNPMIEKYNKLPGVKKVNTKLEDYVTQKAIEGLYKIMEVEEAKIRKDPAARVTGLLKQVFGN